MQELGVEIRLTEGLGGRHVALVFKVDDKDEPTLCHLLWHQWIVSEPASDKHPWIQCALGSSTRRVIAGYCKSIAARIKQDKPKINFGFDGPLRCFNKDGRYIPLKDGEGLTCATFVLEIFANRGVNLLNLQQWPADRPEDKAWQLAIIEELGRTRATLMQKGRTAEADAVGRHINALEKKQGATRCRPEEVAAGVQNVPTPMAFADAEPLGQALLAELQANAATQQRLS